MLTEPTLIAKGMTLQAKPLGEKLQFSIAFVSWSKYRAESPTPTIFVAEGQWATVEDFLLLTWKEKLQSLSKLEWSHKIHSTIC